MQNKVNFKGKPIAYRNRDTLAKKLNITKNQADKLIRDPKIDRIFINEDGDIYKRDIKNSPLLLQNFGISNKNIANKKLLADHAIVKTLDVVDEIPEDYPVKIRMLFTFSFHISKETKTIKKEVTKLIMPKDIEDEFESVVNEFLQPIGLTTDDVFDKKIDIKGDYNGQKYQLIDMKLREDNPLDISNIIPEVNLNKSKDCVRDYLKLLFDKKISIKTIDKLGNEYGVSSKEIIEFAKQYDIPTKIYDINYKLIHNFIPIAKNRNYKSIIFVAYNNHLYPFSKQPTGVKDKKTHTELKLVKNASSELIKQLDNGILPADITYKTDSIKSFIVDKIKYLENDDYEVCKKILYIWGLENTMFDSISKNKLFNHIEKMYVLENIDSFWPTSNSFVKGGFNYDCSQDLLIDEINNNKKKSKIDKNKMYSNALQSLDFLLSFDFRTVTIIKNPKELFDDWIYLIKPKQRSILLPDTCSYDGQHVIFCKNEGLEFEILEGFKCVKHDNFFAKMITDIYTNIKETKIAKTIINVGIGKFETSYKTSSKLTFEGIFNKDELGTRNCFTFKLNDKYTCSFNTEETVLDIYTRKPIAFQLKDKSRRMLYCKMKELKLKNEDIISIRTDSITYFGEIPNNLDSNDLNGWKSEDIKPVVNNHYREDNIIQSFSIPTYNKNSIADCYAGCGKTYYIQNTLIPKLSEDNKKFIVITPSHAALDEYRKDKINCSVIQKYSFQNSIPNEDVIIIDEVGMIDKNGHDIIYKCFLLNKQIYAYGDFKQLPPVECRKNIVKYNSKQYLDLLFADKQQFIENHRNIFSKTYYDKIINGSNKLGLIEVDIHNTIVPLDAEMIICWSNEEVDFWNNYYMYFNKIGEFDKGHKIICKSNKLQDIGIYNNFVYEIDEVNEKDVTFSSGESVSKSKFKKLFKPAYARTLYSIQGKSINSFFFPKSDFKYLNSGEKIYTLISRLIK
jgi:hypothetical protein